MSWRDTRKTRIIVLVQVVHYDGTVRVGEFQVAPVGSPSAQLQVVGYDSLSVVWTKTRIWLVSWMAKQRAREVLLTFAVEDGKADACLSDSHIESIWMLIGCLKLILDCYLVYWWALINSGMIALETTSVSQLLEKEDVDLMNPASMYQYSTFDTCKALVDQQRWWVTLVSRVRATRQLDQTKKSKGTFSDSRATVGPTKFRFEPKFASSSTVLVPATSSDLQRHKPSSYTFSLAVPSDS